MKWTQGRQNNTYFKKKIISFIFFDIYLLKYPTGAYLNTHTDSVEKRRHFRINILLKKANNGGNFYAENVIVHLKRLLFFRPDRAKHGITKVISGTRYVLSIGFVTF